MEKPVKKDFHTNQSDHIFDYTEIKYRNLAYSLLDSKAKKSRKIIFQHKSELKAI